MTRKNLLPVYAVIICFLVSYQNFAANGDLGKSSEPLTDGSQGYPYLIEDLTDFELYVSDSSYWGQDVYVELNCSLDLSDQGTYDEAVIYEFDDEEEIPIAYNANFDGCGYTISNFTVDGYKYCSLFGYIGEKGTVENLNIVGASITGSGILTGVVAGKVCGSIDNCCVASSTVKATRCVGGLVGYSRYGSISNCDIYDSTVESAYEGSCNIGGLVGVCYYGSIDTCSFSGQVINSSGKYIGGIIGYNDYGGLTNCYCDADIKAASLVGGLAGDTNTSSELYIEGCSTKGSIQGNSYVGGLLGQFSSGQMRECYSTAEISGVVKDEQESRFIGGLIGASGAYTSTSSCYYTGSVTGNGYVGGIAGISYISDMTNCYSTGNVTGQNGVGGLVGFMSYGSLVKCYLIGSVSGQTLSGALVGLNKGENNSGVDTVLEDCFWDKDLCGSLEVCSYEENNSSTGTIDNCNGITADQMQISSTFTDADWAFINTENSSENTFWVMKGYPHLKWEKYNIDMEELSLLCSNWQLENGTYTESDWDIDGDVDFDDLEYLAANWLKETIMCIECN